MKLNRNAVWGLGLVYLYFRSTFATGQKHHCDRTCVKGAPAMTCVYNWTLETYLTMNLDCGNCPYNSSDCFNLGCVSANGVERIITVINQQMPGPQIDVCFGDKVVVKLVNHAGVAATTIHWHGINQIGTPYMDGVPMVTQCPIHPFTSFEYTFTPDAPGTFFYHSHMGFQRTDGVNGMLVVRQPKADDPNKSYYDYDLSRHEIMISDWINQTGEEMLTKFYQALNVDYAEFLMPILVNGKGRYELFRNATTGKTFSTPLSTFTVKKGLRYRFRVCSNANWICPVEISVEKHQLVVVGTDADSIKPVKVDAFVINPGERFDFIINANQPIRNYWMTFKGLLRCAILNNVGRALLKYETAKDVEPPIPANVAFKVVLNPVNSPVSNSQQISMSELKSLTPMDPDMAKPKADKQFVLGFDLYPNINPGFPAKNALLPMVNWTSFIAPPSPMLYQFSDIPKSSLCTDTDITKNCTREFCQCTYYLKVQLGQVVEVILVDTGNTTQSDINHPWHNHGMHFRVLGVQLMDSGNTVENVKALDAAGKIKRNLNSPVLKDTVTVPHGGITTIRFKADNPGMWAFHCHVEMHAETGMMIVFQVGEISSFPKVPDGFPRCGNYPK